MNKRKKETMRKMMRGGRRKRRTAEGEKEGPDLGKDRTGSSLEHKNPVIWGGRDHSSLPDDHEVRWEKQSKGGEGLWCPGT